MRPAILKLHLNRVKLLEDTLYATKTVETVSNLYDIIYQTDSLTKLEDLIIYNLSKYSEQDFKLYVKRFQAFIQTENNNAEVKFNLELMRGLKPTAKYSFIYIVKSKNCIAKLQDNDYSLNEGDLLLFKTDEFVKCESTDKSKVAIVGSLTNDLFINNSKTLLI